MDARRTLRLGLLAALIVLAIAGAALLSSRTTPPGSAEPSGTQEATATVGTTATAGAPQSAGPTGTAPATPTDEATGVVVAVDSGGGLGQVRGFTLRVSGGELLTFSLRALENADEFAPGHLVQHQADAFPVRVVYRMDGSERLAIRLEDAPP